MALLTEYEIQRQKNIAANQAILASLGLEKPASFASRPKVSRQSKPKPPQPKAQLKRKAAEAVSTETEDKDQEEGGGRRKSARLSAAARRKANKNAQGSESGSDSSVSMADLHSDSEEGGARGHYNPGDLPGLPRRLVNGRYVAHIDPNWSRPDPKTFGPIPNIPVGSWWPMRQEVSLAGVHGPWVAGISGSPIEGAYSVALSGGYEDDIDEGFRFTFTGEGGRELKKDNLRTAPQSKDQVLRKGNAALVKSFETGKPIRVIRGFKGDKKWAPKSGYRYDGLYTVMKWWEDVGMAGFMVYKFALKRCDGQQPIDLTAGPPADSEAEEESSAEEQEENENKNEKTKEATTKPKITQKDKNEVVDLDHDEAKDESEKENQLQASKQVRAEASASVPVDDVVEVIAVKKKIPAGRGRKARGRK